MNQHNKERIHVACAVIKNSQGEVLLTLRPDHAHQGGLWEYPGGKLEDDENVDVALKRELHEELGITVESSRPLIQVKHDYADRKVLLDVHYVTEYEGEPLGCEGQQLEWVHPDVLTEKDMPAADVPINNAVCLPDCYMITGNYEHDVHRYLAHLKAALEGGIRLVQMRDKHIADSDYRNLATQVIAVCNEYGAHVLLNAEPELVEELGAGGVHLDSKRLMQYKSRPLSKQYLISASCHSADELRQAEELGVNFAVLSPVLKTQSHPDSDPIGWQSFQALIEAVNIPVYALGGMTSNHLATAYKHGAQGIAAISAFWGANA